MNDASPPAPPEATQPAVRKLSQFSFARQWRLTKKEWAETLRDRRTIITLVLMPILVYPLLSMVFHQFVFSSLGKQGKLRVLIAIEDSQAREHLEKTLKFGEMWLEHQTEKDFTGEQIEPALVEEPAVEQISFLTGDVERLIKNNRVDLAVRLLEDAEHRPRWQIQFMEGSSVSLAVRSFIERRLRAANAAVRTQVERQNHIPTIPLEYSMVKAGGGTRSFLPTLVPLVLLMMTITGAVYPAIDVTAGERERGTLEALVAAPVSRLGLLLAKYVAVLTVALLTAGVNMVAMTSTIYATGLSEYVFGSSGVTLSLFLQLLGLLLLFASFFSAVLLAVTSFARSFKEAQAYLIPLMLLTLGPGLMSLSPTLELTEIMAITPLINVVLLAREVFSGTAEPITAWLAVVSTITYAALSIAIAARIFGSDAILYGSSDTWTSLWRRSAPSIPAPSIVATSFALALAFAGQVNLGGTLQVFSQPYGIVTQLLASAGATACIFIGLPLLFALAEHVRLPQAFRLQWSHPLCWFAAALLGLGTGILVMELTLLGTQAGWLEIRKELTQLLAKRAAEFQTVPLPLILFSLAFVPACAEELCFRGYLFKAYETRWGAWSAIVISSLLFAAFHLFSGSGIVFERLLPSLLMGFVLGVVAWRSGSVLPGILLHSLNNAVLLTIARTKDDLVLAGWLTKTSEHLPATWLLAAGAMSLIGILCLFIGRNSAITTPADASNLPDKVA